jgi:hypothetical protein
MRNNLLDELSELNGTIAILEERRDEVIQMLNTLDALEALVPNIFPWMDADHMVDGAPR